jgi:hypothetical protein
MERPSSASLIEQAKREGRLSDETALVYGVFALHDDPRLPAEFRGDDRDAVDTLLMGEARGRLATLSSEARRLLEPFFIPPIYGGSAIGSSGNFTAMNESPDPCAMQKPGWSYLDSSNLMVRIWWQNKYDDRGHVEQMIGWIDGGLWDRLRAIFGGRLPISDIGQPCNGGNGRVDIYLTDAGKAMTTPYGECGNTAAFITAGRANGLMGRLTLAHELAHVFQYAYAFADGCLWHLRNRWLAEATATWAGVHIYPTLPGRHRSARKLTERPHLPLDLVDQNGREYGAYLIHYFSEKKLGGAGLITQAWANVEREAALDAVDRSLPGGFLANWPDFAAHNWNRDPLDFYQSWDSDLTASAAPAHRATIALGSRTEVVIPIDVQLPHLSAQYSHFIFEEDQARSVGFFNGWTYNFQTRPFPTEPRLGSIYGVTELNALQREGRNLRGVVKVNGRWRAPVDLTDKPSWSLCRQNPDERIEEMVLIFSNSRIDRQQTVIPAGLSPLLHVSNVGCKGWTGTIRFTDEVEFGAPWKVEWRVDYRAPIATGPAQWSFTGTGSGTWSVDGVRLECGYSGRGTVPVNVNQLLATWPITPPASRLHRTFSAGAGSMVPVTYTTCIRSVTDLVPPVGLLMHWALKISDDGMSLKGQRRYDEDDGPVGLLQWNLVAVE